jgi:hypothetical protein
MDKDDICCMFVQRVGSENILYLYASKCCHGSEPLDKTICFLCLVYVIQQQRCVSWMIMCLGSCNGGK